MNQTTYREFEPETYLNYNSQNALVILFPFVHDFKCLRGEMPWKCSGLRDFLFSLWSCHGFRWVVNSIMVCFYYYLLKMLV